MGWPWRLIGWPLLPRENDGRVYASDRVLCSQVSGRLLGHPPRLDLPAPLRRPFNREFAAICPGKVERVEPVGYAQVVRCFEELRFDAVLAVIAQLATIEPVRALDVELEDEFAGLGLASGTWLGGGQHLISGHATIVPRRSDSAGRFARKILVSAISTNRRNFFDG
jgi:hypothetical protein